MDELKVIADVVAVLQVGFAGFVSIYLLKLFRDVQMDLLKQMAVILSILTELRTDLNTLARSMPKREGDEIQHAGEPESGVGPSALRTQSP